YRSLVAGSLSRRSGRYHKPCGPLSRRCLGLRRRVEPDGQPPRSKPASHGACSHPGSDAFDGAPSGRSLCRLIARTAPNLAEPFTFFPEWRQKQDRMQTCSLIRECRFLAPPLVSIGGLYMLKLVLAAEIAVAGIFLFASNALA